MNKVLLLCLLAFSMFSLAHFANAKTHTSSMCPTTAAEAKQIFSGEKAPKLTDKCYSQLLQHLANGEADWINNAQSLMNSKIIGFNEGIPLAMTYAIIKNPGLMLQIIDQESNPDTYKKWCVSPFVEATTDEITSFNNAAISALKNAKVSPYFEKLRQQCIDSFIHDRDESFKCELRTPAAVSASVERNHGQELLFGNNQCDIMLSSQLSQLKPEWIAILPALTNKQALPELREYILNMLIKALPKSPEVVLKILSQHYDQQQLAQACHPTLYSLIPNTEATGIKIEIDPYHNPDNYQLNVPKTVQALSQLKPSDPGISKARDICLKKLQQSLQELQQKTAELKSRIQD
jgi:hypothetical protein